MSHLPVALTRLSSSQASSIGDPWSALLPRQSPDHALFLPLERPHEVPAAGSPRYPMLPQEPVRALQLAFLALQAGSLGAASVLLRDVDGSPHAWTLYPLHSLPWGVPVLATLLDLAWGESPEADQTWEVREDAPLEALLCALNTAASGHAARVALRHRGVTLLLGAPHAAPHAALRAEAEHLLARLNAAPEDLEGAALEIQQHTLNAHAAFMESLHDAHAAFMNASLAALAARPRVALPPPAPTPQHTLQRLDAPASLLALPHLRPGASVLILDDPSELTQSLINALRQHDLRVARASSLPDDAASYDILLLTRGLHGVDHLDDALAVLHHVRDVVHQLGARPARRPRALITVHDTRGTFGYDATPEPHRAPLAAIPAVARALRDLDPDATVRSIDLERGARSPAALGRLVVAELLAGGPEPLVGLQSNGARSTLQPVPLPTVGTHLPTPASRLAFVTPDPVGVDHLLALQLAEPAPLALIAPAFPEDLLDQLRAAGAPVHLIPCSLRRPEALAAAVQQAHSAVGSPEELLAFLPRRLASEDAPRTLRALLQLLQLHQSAPPRHVHLLLPADTADDATWRPELAALDVGGLYARAWLPESSALTLSHLDPHRAAHHLRRASAGQRLACIDGDPTPAPTTVAVSLDPAQVPALHDATLWGKRGLPIALVVEWFVRFAWTLLPHLQFTALTRLRVARLLLLPDWPAEAPQLTLHARPVEDPDHHATLHLQLHAEGALCYEALIHLDAEDAALPVLIPVELPELEPARLHAGRWASPEGSALGPRLHSLHPLGSGVRAAEAALFLQPSPWPQPIWTEPHALDAALQLALWWRLEQRGEQAQIASIGRLLIAGRPSPHGDHRARLLSLEPDHADLQVIGEDRAVLLQALDVHILPARELS